MTRPEDCDALIARAVEEFGGVDVLINNAGVASAVPATRETPEAFRAVVDVNLHGTYWMALACVGLRLWRRRPHPARVSAYPPPDPLGHPPHQGEGGVAANNGHLRHRRR